MALTNLKQEDDGVTEYQPCVFGYGTEIYLNGEQTEKMGLKRMAADQEVILKATGIVTRSTEEIEAKADSGGKDLSISIQLIAVEVKSTGTANTARAAAILYGDEN